MNEQAEEVDFFNVVARKKLGVGIDWIWCKSEVIGEPGVGGADFLIEGGVPRTLKSGPNKGKPSWRGVPLLRCVVTKRELVEAQSNYEASTGRCHVCQGAGKQPWGWSATDGRRYRDCKRCAATSEAPK